MRTVRLLVTATLWGCAGQAPYTPPPVYTPPPPPTFAPAPTVSVQTPGVVLHAEDGGFSLDANATAAPFDLGSSCIGNPTTSDVGQAEAYGGRRVKITLPPELASAAGGQTELHGLLAICGVPPGASGAAARHYAIQVPSARVEQTSGGRVSLVYEPFTGGSAGSHAWMLWLSASPLPPPPPAAAQASRVNPYAAGPATPSGKASPSECETSIRRLEFIALRDSLKNVSPEQHATLTESIEKAFAEQRPQQVGTCLASFSSAAARCQARAETMQAWAECGGAQ